MTEEQLADRADAWLRSNHTTRAKVRYMSVPIGFLNNLVERVEQALEANPEPPAVASQEAPAREELLALLREARGWLPLDRAHDLKVRIAAALKGAALPPPVVRPQLLEKEQDKSVSRVEPSDSIPSVRATANSATGEK